MLCLPLQASTMACLLVPSTRRIKVEWRVSVNGPLAFYGLQ